jgi:hypothetical protein
MYTFLKNEGQEGKTGLFCLWESVVGSGHKERLNESEYGGCILYVKTEELNLLKLF